MTLRDILGCFGTFGTFWDILGHLGTFWEILWCFGTFLDILGSFGTFWDTLGRFGTFWVLGSHGSDWLTPLELEMLAHLKIRIYLHIKWREDIHEICDSTCICWFADLLSDLSHLVCTSIHSTRSKQDNLLVVLDLVYFLQVSSSVSKLMSLNTIC